LRSKTHGIQAAINVSLLNTLDPKKITSKYFTSRNINSYPFDGGSKSSTNNSPSINMKNVALQPSPIHSQSSSMTPQTESNNHRIGEDKTSKTQIDSATEVSDEKNKSTTNAAKKTKKPPLSANAVRRKSNTSIQSISAQSSDGARTIQSARGPRRLSSDTTNSKRRVTSATAKSSTAESIVTNASGQDTIMSLKKISKKGNSVEKRNYFMHESDSHPSTYQDSGISTARSTSAQSTARDEKEKHDEYTSTDDDEGHANAPSDTGGDSHDEDSPHETTDDPSTENMNFYSLSGATLNFVRRLRQLKAHMGTWLFKDKCSSITGLNNAIESAGNLLL
jgi:hypothetical protein